MALLPRVHIVGRKNSGKTTLITDLVAHLAARGVRVGTIKHTHHHHELDVPGKDSHRHRQAGAAAVGILAPGMHALFWPTSDSQSKNDRYAALLSRFEGLALEIVLVEGDTQTDSPKIEVWRAASMSPPLAVEGVSVLAIISDDPCALHSSVIPRSPIDAAADFVLTAAGLFARRSS